MHRVLKSAMPFAWQKKLQWGGLTITSNLKNPEPGRTVSQEELARADAYRLMARLLAAPPDSELLGLIQGFQGDDSVFGQAVGALAEAAGTVTEEGCREEYQNLFIGVGRGELVPFASFYLTGFLHEKPLAKLRGDLRLLGISRQEGVHEPEDHIAALCEVMAGLISGELAACDLAEQKRFFNLHLVSWAIRFFNDLQTAKSAGFYRCVGKVGHALLTIEAEGFAFIETT